MEFFETIYSRKTIRKYKKEHPPIEDIKKIIDSARLAPSATNSQNWKFIAIYNDSVKQKMAEAVEIEYERLKEQTGDEEMLSKINRFKTFSVFFKDAPVVIACVETERKSAVTDMLLEKGIDYREILLLRPDSSLLSMGAAIENMSLSAAALGYGTCWMCAPIVAYKEFKKILNLNETDKIVSLLTVGIPQNDNPNQPPKKELYEIIKIIE